ncbi:MAG: PLP-dependent aspartate aminotransferase family protein [Planctomycetota bacterium]|nr:PLP-dependent aspartate aminotransferase family protein [Planctomycetota bacterium]
MTHQEDLHPDTMSVHAGVGEFEHRPVVPPIHQTSTFGFDNVDQGAALFAGKEQGYIYSRMGNPTVGALEGAIAELEGGHGALACGSGMAAIHTAFAAFLDAGDHVVCSEAVYGPTCTLLETQFARYGVQATFVDTSDVGAVQRAMRPETKVLFVESPGNPTLVVSDLAAMAAIAQEWEARLIVDNTFMSPVLQQPLALGAHVVVHSLTKFLNGHADVVGGAIVAKTQEDHVHLRKVLNHLGGVLPPLESFLVHRGIKTLALRMERHAASAIEVARHLEGHEAVAWVRYPGLPSHPQHEVHMKQSRSGGGMVAFELCGGVEAGKAMMNAVKLCGLAVSLGGVETLIQHPASMTHASMGPEARARAGISDGLVRLSVGIEHLDDILTDLDQALGAAQRASEGAGLTA